MEQTLGQRVRASVKKHFQRHLGVGARKVIAGGGVDVVMWPDPDDPDTVVLATVGMAARAQHLPKEASCPSAKPRTESVMYSRKDSVRDAAALLEDLAEYPAREQTFLHWWHALPLGRAIALGSGLSSVFLSFPDFMSSEFATFTAERKRVDILWVIPISEAERKVFDARGANKLEELLESKEVPLADFARASTV
jgi:hypothetical protein